MSDLPEKLTPKQVIEAVTNLARAYGYEIAVVSILNTGNLSINVTRDLFEAGIVPQLVANELAPSEK